MGELFDAFEERPVGAASIAQAHRATLAGGEQVLLRGVRRQAGRLPCLQRLALRAHMRGRPLANPPQPSLYQHQPPWRCAHLLSRIHHLPSMQLTATCDDKASTGSHCLREGAPLHRRHLRPLRRAVGAVGERGTESS